MTLNEQWQDILKTLPLVAILRGLRPDESLSVGEMLVEAGFRIVEGAGLARHRRGRHGTECRRCRNASCGRRSDLHLAEC